MTFAQSLSEIHSLLPPSHRNPKLAIVCGSGLSTLSSSISNPISIPYSSITGFVESTVEGHLSELVFGTIGGVQIVAQLGRFHAYEGFELGTVIHPMRIFKLLGVESVILTYYPPTLLNHGEILITAIRYSNAAGGLDPAMDVGTIVVIQDHISLPSLVNRTLFSSYTR